MLLPHRPTVTLHFAQSLDGRIAAAGMRTELSTQEGLIHAHRARASHDAVLVGIKTVLIDNPILSVRLCPGPQPIRIVLSSTLFIPESSQLLNGPPGQGGPLIVIGAQGIAEESEEQKLKAKNALAFRVEASPNGQVSLPHALYALYERGIRRLLVEGGSHVLTSFIQDRLADAAEIEVAPQFMGGEGISVFGPLRNENPARAASLQSPAVERLGENFLIRGPIEYP